MPCADLFQKLHASSMANSTPPIGAPKAAEMPAAVPADTNSRWSADTQHRRSRRQHWQLWNKSDDLFEWMLLLHVEEVKGM